ncbi:hypothetical protein V12B01_13545 [Vibrio splendidus 12B01]|nr:hypothetical protein V12B01_13545 [Vibrio splendidus 12B01]
MLQARQTWRQVKLKKVIRRSRRPQIRLQTLKPK